MASAFYPTGDGHVGNLGKKTLPELRELLIGQERLMKKKMFLNSLPDKGAKVLHFAETLQRTIKSREKSEEMFGMTSSNETNSDIVAISKDGHKGVSRFKKEKEKERRKVETINKDIDDMIDIKNNSLSEQTAFTGDVLERSFQNMSVTDDTKDSGEKDDSVLKQKHFYELAEESAKRNAADLKEPFKLNSSLNIITVQDLPAKFVHPTLTSRQPEQKMELDQKPLGQKTSHPYKHIIEDTAATPPTYKYDKVKGISLDESLLLQKSQKVKQDELQAEIAAERLAERLHIKLEPYNPEGVAMSYRVSHTGGQAHMIDSDDDEDDDNDDGVKIISDSDDES